MTRLALLSALLAIAAAVACGGGGDPPDEAAVLASVTDMVIVPGYESVAERTGRLRESLDQLCAGPSETSMEGARQAWRDAREPWMRSEATWFGPVHDRRSLGVVDWPQVRPDRIEAMLETGPATTDEHVRDRLASTQRGLGAIEYVLFEPGAVGALSQRETGRCGYLKALGRVVEAEAAGIAEAWSSGTDGGPAYKDFFTGRSDSSLLTGQAVGDMVRTQVFLMRTLVDMRLASAMGLREGGHDLTALPGGNGLNALSDLRNEVLGIRDVYLGAGKEGDLGVSDLVRELSEETDERMREQFDSSLAAIDAVQAPLRTAVVERPEQVREVYDRLMDLQRTLSTEVVSLLGVSVGFSDTDGDSLR